MSQLGSVPAPGLRFASHTIAASAAGTAAATVLGTVTATYARAWEVFNLSLRNLELIIGPDPGTAAIGTFCPGTASATLQGLGSRAPIALQLGYIIRARTVENTPITLSATLPLYINLWA